MNALKHIRQNTTRPKKNDLEQNEPHSLIRNDIVTCAHYYRSRKDALHQLIAHDYKYYGEIDDFFYVTEFQNRGSENEHGLIWIKSAPIYGRNWNIDVENFVDKYLSTHSLILPKELRTIQNHCHIRTCRKHKNSKCRFNFPMPPMKTKKILEPLEFYNAKTKTNAKIIFDTINNVNYDQTIHLIVSWIELD